MQKAQRRITPDWSKTLFSEWIVTKKGTDEEKFGGSFFFQLKDLNKNFWINSSLERKAQVPQLLNREYWQNSSTSISVCLSFKASNKFKLLTVLDPSSLYYASPIKRICVKWVCGFDLYFHPILILPILFSSPWCSIPSTFMICIAQLHILNR